MWTEVSSSVLHFLQMALLPSPITYECLFRMFCPVRRLVTTLDCVLLKDNNWALVAKLGPKVIWMDTDQYYFFFYVHGTVHRRI